MDSDFWHQRWKNNEIAFHANEANPHLVNHFEKLSLEKGSRIFLPLCGKTLDISWLISNGFKVVGAELSQIAIQQLFEELGLEPIITTAGKVTHYSANSIDIFVGDLFDLTRDILGPVDAIYDRAALVALPESMRPRYTSHLVNIAEEVPQLLICFEYNQTLQEGPPFSINQEELHFHYTKNYQLTLLEIAELPGGLKGKCPAKETVWLLKNN